MIKIIENPERDTYSWWLYDGPDGIDVFSGEESSLGEVFEKIIYHRTINGLDYHPDTFETGTGT